MSCRPRGSAPLGAVGTHGPATPGSGAPHRPALGRARPARAHRRTRSARAPCVAARAGGTQNRAQATPETGGRPAGFSPSRAPRRSAGVRPCAQACRVQVLPWLHDLAREGDEGLVLAIDVATRTTAPGCDQQAAGAAPGRTVSSLSPPQGRETWMTPPLHDTGSGVRVAVGPSRLASVPPTGPPATSMCTEQVRPGGAP